LSFKRLSIITIHNQLIVQSIPPLNNRSTCAWLAFELQTLLCRMKSFDAEISSASSSCITVLVRVVGASIDLGGASIGHD